MSNRYATIVALLDDPLNVACVVREIIRQGFNHVQLLPPPLPRKGGGWVFPSFSMALREPLPSILDPDQKIEFEFEVRTDGTRWIVLTREGAEIGPFGDEEVALQEARVFAMGEGFILLNRMPWDNTDVLKFNL